MISHDFMLPSITLNHPLLSFYEDKTLSKSALSLQTLAHLITFKYVNSPIEGRESDPQPV